jgi:hypothetical protein
LIQRPFKSWYTQKIIYHIRLLSNYIVMGRILRFVLIFGLIVVVLIIMAVAGLLDFIF